MNIGSTKAGINMDAVKLMGEIVLATAEKTAEQHGFGCAKLVVFANSVGDNPFMAGAYHGVEEAGLWKSTSAFPALVWQPCFGKSKRRTMDIVADTIEKAAFQITRMGQLVGNIASQKLGVPFGIVDLALAPTPAVGDSVGEILEEFRLGVVGNAKNFAALMY